MDIDADRPVSVPASRSRLLADAALEIARSIVESSIPELADLAGSDREALLRASELVRVKRPDRPSPDRAVQHVAFSLLSALFGASLSDG